MTNTEVTSLAQQLAGKSVQEIIGVLLPILGDADVSGDGNGNNDVADQGLRAIVKGCSNFRDATERLTSKAGLSEGRAIGIARRLVPALYNSYREAGN